MCGAQKRLIFNKISVKMLNGLNEENDCFTCQLIDSVQEILQLYWQSVCYSFGSIIVAVFISRKRNNGAC